MLPSIGYFKEIKCPFYNSSKDQCTRPYCHFRHLKQDLDDVCDDGASVRSDTDFPQDGENERLLASLDCLSRDDNAETTEETKAPSSTAAAQSNSKPTSSNPYMPAVPPPTYKPTPIAALKSAHLPIPYTPLVVSRTPTAKKSKARQEYVPHSVGEKPYFPPYSPASTAIPATPRINNTLYEIYGPEGAQFSPNDAEPSGTGYSYGSADYKPKVEDGVSSNRSNAVGRKATLAVDPSFSPPDSPPPSPPSPPSTPPSSPPPASPPLSPKSPTPSPISADFDLSELDKLELEYESETEERPPSRTKESAVSQDKRKRSGSPSGSESKKVKVSHSEKERNGHKESEKSSSRSEKKEKHSSSSRNSSSSTRSSQSKSHKSSSSSSSHKRSSSSSDRKKDKHREHSERERSRHKEKSDSKDKTTSSDRNRRRSRDRSEDKHRSKSKHSGKDSDRHKSKETLSKHSRRSSNSSNSSGSKPKVSLLEEDKEELRRVEADLDADLEDADLIEQQCLELFSEYDESTKASEATSKEDPRVSIQAPSEEIAATLAVKKRVAHSNAASVYVPIVKPTTAPKVDPHSIMKERFEKVITTKPVLVSAKPYSATNPIPLTTTVGLAKRKMIRSVPNVTKLLERPVIPTTTNTAPANRMLDPETQRVDEYGRVVKARLAHAPSAAAQAARKPLINPSDCLKFKASTRQAFVDKLFEAYQKAGFGEASYDMALDSERASTQGTDSASVYSHRIITLIKEMRSISDTRSDSNSVMVNRPVSHSAVLAGKRGASVSWSIEKVKKKADITEDATSLYDNLSIYVLSKEQLEENGFPMQSEEKGYAVWKKNGFRVVEQPSTPHERICVRCQKRYTVNKHGEQVVPDECVYHWGRRITVRRFREMESKYVCCDTLDQGCTVGPCHVYEPNENRRSGFMSTLSKSYDDRGVYALDCEMSYTTAGLELTRVTVVKSDLSVAYETLVKPKNKIIDYNTRYSGLTEEDMKNASTSLIQVQATLLGMFSDKTILIGHSLESDMKALKLIHPTVVDTSVVFPHKMGQPYKRALRTLASDFLQKIIQNDVSGHDSKEDAVTAMELMLWKVKEDAKLR